MSKINKNAPQALKQEQEPDDFDAFMEAVGEMEPEEAKIMFNNIIEAMKEEGEPVPFPLRLITSDIHFGISHTPAGLAYGFSGLGQLLSVGFITEDDIDQMGDVETVLEAIADDFLGDISAFSIVRDDDAVEALLKSALDGSYEMLDEAFDSLDPSDLQRAVWMELTKIPYGETISYEELARRIGKPKAVRAVASAVGENPVSIAIPCHRVILKSGNTGEYYWGSDIKEKLLAYEQDRKK